jgi:hypothetical protein
MHISTIPFLAGLIFAQMPRKENPIAEEIRKAKNAARQQKHRDKTKLKTSDRNEKRAKLLVSKLSHNALRRLRRRINRIANDEDSSTSSGHSETETDNSDTSSTSTKTTTSSESDTDSTEVISEVKIVTKQ